MCEECGCGNPDTTKTENLSYSVNKSVTEVNDVLAEQISEFLSEKKILGINLMGSPGSGKTSFIEGLCRYMNPSDIAVIQGDLESDIDKKRMEQHNLLSFQINTHSGCHLTAAMINKALLNLDVTDKKYLIIENVGNLVCPAGQRIGQHINIVVSSTTEGTDKPKKYPYIFMDAHLVILSKYDLADRTDFNEDQYIQDIRHINANATVMKISSKDIASFEQPARYLEHHRNHLFAVHHTH
jgi:hydrogenase nickel incorporation protein HypB